MSYEGNVADLDLVGRLVDLSREHFTGAMRFENDGIIKIIYFKDGDILSASTNDRTDSIDEMLLRSGKITREHLKQALDKRKENETLGDALLNLGFITRKELTWARRVQVLGIIRSILGWNAGNYTVVSDYLPKREEGTIFPLPQIVIELIVTEPDRARFERLLDSGNATYERDADFDGRFRQLGLNQDAEEIAAAIDGARSAAEVAAATGKDAFNVYKLLHALELLGMLHRVDRSPRPAPAPPASPFVAEEAWAAHGVEDSLPVDPMIPPAGLRAPDKWGATPTSRLDPFESSENAPAASTVPSTTLPLELSGIDPPPDRSEAELTHDVYDPETVRSQVEENLGGDQLEEGQPRRRGWIGALVAIVLILLLGAAGYLYWLRRQSGGVASAAISPSERAGAPVGAGTTAPATTSVTANGGRTASTEVASAPSAVVNHGTSATDGGSFPGGATPGTSSPGTSTVPSAVITTAAAITRATSTSTGHNDRSTIDSRKDVSRRHGAKAAPRAHPSSTSPAQRGVSEPGETQFVPATATSRARITNVGHGDSANRKGPDSATAAQKPPATDVVTAPAANDPLRARYDSLASRHAASVPADQPYTVQIELVCRTESITRALRAGGGDVWFVPTSFHGQSCYRVFWRHFRSAAAAKEGVATVPAALGAGSTPTVARVP